MPSVSQAGGGFFARLRTTLKPCVAGVGSRFPARSTERTENTWRPRPSFVSLIGELHDFHSPASSLQRNDEAGSLVEKPKRALPPLARIALPTRFLGRNLTLVGGTSSKTVSGAVESSLNSIAWEQGEMLAPSMERALRSVVESSWTVTGIPGPESSAAVPTAAVAPEQSSLA